MKLDTYMEQLERAANAAGCDLKKIARDIGYSSNISRWLNRKFSPREEQARRMLDAISGKTRQQ